MRCDRVQYFYEDYVRSSLPLTAMGRIEEHLAGCPACREYYEHGDALADVLRRHADVAHPGPRYFDVLAERVLGQLDAPAGRAEPEGVLPPPGLARRWPGPLWWAGGVAAAALVALGLMPAALAPATRPHVAPATHTVAMASMPATGTAPTAAIAPTGIAPTSIAPTSPTPLSVSALFNADSVHRVMSTIERGLSHGVGEVATGSSVPTGAASPSPAERATAREASLRLASLRRQAPSEVPTEVLKQIQVIKAQLVSGGGDEALTQSLKQLEQTVQDRIGDQASLAGLPWVRQASLYLKAEAALSAGDPTAASTYYRNILMIDDTTPPAEQPSPLALRACLQLGDLFYGEWADFATARDYYRRCASPKAAEALTSVEREHVTRQLDRLDKYAANQWEDLQLLHIVRREGWPEATTALRKLLADPSAAALLPEAARALADRMNATPKPSAQTTVEIYNLLAKQADVEQNGDVRAWLELTLGDVALAQFKDPQQAIERYRKAAAGTESGAAASARSKLNDLIERQLLNLVR